MAELLDLPWAVSMVAPLADTKADAMVTMLVVQWAGALAEMLAYLKVEQMAAHLADKLDQTMAVN